MPTATTLATPHHTRHEPLIGLKVVSKITGVPYGVVRRWATSGVVVDPTGPPIRLRTKRVQEDGKGRVVLVATRAALDRFLNEIQQPNVVTVYV